jgi:hypothetical protein
MLRLFSKVRNSLLSEGKLLRYLSYAIDVIMVIRFDCPLSLLEDKAVSGI